MTRSAVDRLNAALDGRYRIDREIGEGGMATVYLADDVRHERRVAVKVLKPELAAVVGAERFLAEIKTTANLQHPHILALFDSGEADGFLFYVMPYIEGETLGDRIDREKQLPVDEAIGIATAVAHALQTAHDAGVVHRDIKPGNILLSRGEPLVADFGIALAVGGASGARLTETGLSIGTPYYMSPEQATGDQVVGPSSDTFALACVLYEMLVGEPPYPGTTAQAVLGRIIQGAPVSATGLRPSVPANVDAAIRKALEKLPADRFAAAKEFAKALADPGFRHGEPVAAAPSSDRRWRMATSALATTTLVFALVSTWALTRSPPPAAPHRVSVLLPEPRGGVLGSMALSRDGSLMVYEGPSEDGGSQLLVRRWSELNATPLPGSQGGTMPSVSPDAREVVFVQVTGGPPRQLLVASLVGGVPRVVTESANREPHWGTDGFIYFTDAETGGISRVPAEGGPEESITQASADRGELGHTGAYLVEGGESVLFHVVMAAGSQLRAIDLSTREVRSLDQVGVRPHVTSSGHLLYLAQSGNLVAAPFDPGRLELTGPAVPVIDGVAFDLTYSPFALSENGTLVYPTGSNAVSYLPVWVDRAGAVTPVDPEWTYDPGVNNRGLALSPDGTRLAVAVMGDVAEDIWIKQLPRGPLTRLTVDSAQDVRPRWTRDGRVTYISEREGRTASVYAQRADGTGRPELLLTHEQALWEGMVSADGTWLIARTGGTLGAAGGRDVISIRPGEDEEPTPLIVTAFDEKAIALSPDGRWLAYESDETGRNEIYVRPFPDVDGGKWPVSVGGGVMPAWAHDGEEIFYVNGQNEMVAARVLAGAGFEVETRDVLFSIGPEFLIQQAEQYTLYDVSPDDERFVMLQRSDFETPELILVQNFLEELRARVPK